MNPIYVPLFSALAGAVIGSLSSIATIFIQAKIGERRERIRQAAMLALEEFKTHIAQRPPGGTVPPISIYVHHQLAILNAIEKNDLTPERLRQIAANDEALIAATLELDRQYQSRRRAET
jgi:hypothetical protein